MWPDVSESAPDDLCDVPGLKLPDGSSARLTSPFANCGSLDPWLDDQTRVVEQRYKELGGQITVIVKEGQGHLPLAPEDPKVVVDLITRGVH